MLKENALRLLSFYDYEFNLAKLHVLYPMVMNCEENRATMVQLAKSHPEQLAQEVSNAIISSVRCSLWRL